MGFTFDFITQSKLLGVLPPKPPVGGVAPPPNPPRISFSVGCLQAAADASVII
ncbi:hypothetical protein VL20_5922 [Microcystis panniformis FACHB-1757]|uniref:Mobile element protein n=1 Tax=Microcystis panniformis FACHB-1757 TaxID=1638788 RepID=A0A0K1S9B1_9CHRO|nr:hypothetical protein VL20_5922 [Microcystis panniformis FACHB-1757]